MKLRQVVPFAGLALTLALTGCPPQRISEKVEVAGVSPADPLVKRIQQDPIAVLQGGLDWYDRTVKDYTCTLYKQERMDPAGPMLPEQKIACKFRDRPFSVYTDTLVNPRGAAKALYVEGQWGNKLLAQPAGLGVLLGTLVLDPRGAQARANALRFIDQFGFKRSLEALIASYQIARKEGILRIAVVGEGKVGGRATIIIEVTIKEPKPTGRFEFPHVRLYVDREWLVPIGVDLWDASNVERAHYRYADVKFNVGLTDKDFTPETYGMRSPKPAAASQPAGQ